MKLLTLALILSSSCTLFGQIKFSNKTLDNGMLFPIAHMNLNPSVADSMNAVISRNLSIEAESDFCIGDYGYYQKGNHLELHLICNCIDFVETEHKYLFFSLETGSLVAYSDLFEAKKTDEVISYINKKVRTSEIGCKSNFGPMETDLNWDEITFHMYKDGLEISPLNSNCKIPVRIPWTELTSYLRYSFL